MSSVRLDRISKSYGSSCVLDDVVLDIDDGEFVTLLGPSGSGKTTLLRIIAGLVAPSSGALFFGERPVTHLPPNKRNIAMVFQDYALYPNMRVEENMGFCLKLRGAGRRKIRDHVGPVARTLGIDALLRRWPDELSGGQKQRVALGRAMVRQPEVFLLDEPLSNLDAQLRFAMRAELQKIHRRLGTTVIHVTHDQEEALSVSQRVALINRGKVEQFGAPGDLYLNPRNTFVARFIGTPSINLLPCELLDTEGTRRIVGRSVSIALPDRDVLDSSRVRDRRILVGLRPEDLSLVPDPGGGELRGSVTVVEWIGKEAVVYLTTEGGEEIAARTPATFALDVGQPVGVRLSPRDLYFFDETSGESLGRPRETR